MRTAICFLILILTGVSFSQNLSRTEALTEKIEHNLHRLEDYYLVKLKNKDYKKAKDILDNIYSLLNELRQPVLLPIDESSFNALKETIAKESFSSNRISIIETAAEKNHFTMHQLIEIVELLNYSDERVKAISIIYPWIVDKNNSLLIFNALKFSSEKDEVKKIIERYR